MHSHSSTQSFNTCHYKYKLEKVDMLPKRVSYTYESNDRVWGNAMHAGFKAVHLGQSLIDSTNVFTDLYPRDLGDPYKEFAWTREGGVRTLQEYHERYQLMSTEWETLAVESDNRELGEDEDEYGHLVIDWVARQRASGSIYFWDHKFKHRINSTSLKQYDIDSQVSRYAAYISDKYGECAGCIIQFVCPYFLKKEGKVRPKGWSFQFEIGVYERTREHIEQWRREQADWEWEIQTCKDADRWTKHKGWQCPKCDFYDICWAEREGGSSEHVRQTMVEGTLTSDDIVVTFEEE